MEKRIMISTSAYSSEVVTLLQHPVRNILSYESQYIHQEQVSEELGKLTELKQGWDGYKADPVSIDNAKYALRILEGICSENTPPPHIVPGINGDLQLEWHTDSVEIELHIIGPNNVYFWTNDPAICPDDEAIHIKASNFTGVSSKIAELSETGNDRIAA
jgi:hypothetical protein